jgi:hypothetical protein
MKHGIEKELLPPSHIVSKKKISRLLRKVKCGNLKYDFLCFSRNKFHGKM